MLDETKNQNKSESPEQNEPIEAGLADATVPAEDELMRELEAYKDRYLRAVAETENVRRIAEREKENAIKFGASTLAKEILPFIDNLERAAAYCGETCPENEGESVLAGLRMIVGDILASLKKHGIEKIESTGQAFNPELHQAVAEVSSAEHEQGTVVETLMPGYTLHGRLLRAATVTVAK